MKSIYTIFLTMFFIGTLAAQETNIKFETGTFNQALEKAKQEGKYLFIDCYATW